MATLSLSDSEKTANFTLTDAALCIDDAPMANLFVNLDAFNTLIPLASVTLAANVYTFTLKDARSMENTLQIGPPAKTKTVSGDFFSVPELNVIRATGISIVALMTGNGLSAMTITYA